MGTWDCSKKSKHTSENKEIMDVETSFESLISKVIFISAFAFAN